MYFPPKKGDSQWVPSCHVDNWSYDDDGNDHFPQMGLKPIFNVHYVQLSDRRPSFIPLINNPECMEKESESPIWNMGLGHVTRAFLSIRKAWRAHLGSRAWTHIPMIYGLKIVGAHSSVQPIPAPIWASLCLKLFYPAPRGAFRLLLRRLFTFFCPAILHYGRMGQYMWIGRYITLPRQGLF